MKYGKEKKNGVSRLVNNNAYQRRGRIASNIERDNYKANKNNSKQTNPDTLIRYEIQHIIKSMLAEKKGKIEILTYLNNTYQEFEYAKYFSTWIDHQIKKLNIEVKENSGEERE